MAEDELGKIDDYLGPQKLEADFVVDNKMPFVCIGISKQQFEDSKTPTLRLDLKNGDNDYYLNLNKTNLGLLQESMHNNKLDKLVQFVGCVFNFDKAKVRNPKSGKMQDSLYIAVIKIV